MRQNQIRQFMLMMIATPLLGLLFSCSQDNSKPKDLSFGGITIGEVFPDSLKNSFVHSPELGIPTYEGGIKFDFPSAPKSDVFITAATESATDEVICIDILMEADTKAYDFYDMLNSKYGLPTSKYGDTDCSLQYFLNRLYVSIQQTPYFPL